MFYTKDYFNSYLKERHLKLTLKCIDILGGKCVICGTTENLQFDHIDPKTKSFDISRARSHKWEDVLRELKKCQLLCKPHHVEKCYREGSYKKSQHGTVNMYTRHGCRCVDCVMAYRKNRLDYYHKNKSVINARRVQRRVGREA